MLNPSGYFLALSKGCVLQLWAGDGVNGAFCGSVDCGNICFCHNVNVQQFGDVSPAGKRGRGAGRQDELSHSRTNQCACGAFRQIYAALPPSPTLALRRIENNLHNFQRFSVVTHHAYPLLPPLPASDFIVDVLFGNLSSSESAPIMKVGVPSSLPCAPRDRRRRCV